jgi:hypothetical protein
MKLHYSTLLIGITIMLSQIASAQKVIPVDKSLDDALANRCEKCDSLGDAFLQTGDTSMALYYFNNFLEANPHEEQTKTAIKKFRKLYTRYSNSFYLKEY